MAARLFVALLERLSEVFLDRVCEPDGAIRQYTARTPNHSNLFDIQQVTMSVYEDLPLRQHLQPILDRPLRRDFQFRRLPESHYSLTNVPIS